MSNEPAERNTPDGLELPVITEVGEHDSEVHLVVVEVLGRPEHEPSAATMQATGRRNVQALPFVSGSHYFRTLRVFARPG